MLLFKFNNIFQNELANLKDRKAAMLTLNISTHRLITDLGQKMLPTTVALKDEVSDLYRLWDEAFQKYVVISINLSIVSCF
jgi:hypothetical protein